MEKALTKQCGFVIRVSTDRQAANQEGSLKNQLQRLRAHVEYKNSACGENWTEAERYVLRAVSGKDSMRSKEFARLFEDIRSGKINTVVCTALDRISRSVRDFLNFFEILNDHDVEFVCLKQNYDTTTPQGKLFTTVMMALAQFEREQTSDRNKEATLARAERGLWNGGHLIGYDLDEDRKGNLIPNERETIIVNFAYDTYLKCGSIQEAMKAVNGRGYRTKEYTSRRGKSHSAREFSYTGIQWMLMNPAYVGKKEINKGNRFKDQSTLPESKCYRLVDAVWEPIVDEDKFRRVQELMQRNGQTKHNGARQPKHNYLLSYGLLECGKCGTEMQVGAGTGRNGKRYHYYVCKNPNCRFKGPAEEVEGLILERIGQIAKEPATLSSIVAATNEKLRTEIPTLRTQQQHLENELEEVKAKADALISEWTSLAGDDGTSFLKDNLDDLGKRRAQIEESLAAIEIAIGEIDRDMVDAGLVTQALADFSGVFAELKPYEQKELMRLVLHKAILGPDSLKIGLYGRPPEAGQVQEGESRFQTFKWLPVCNPLHNRSLSPAVNRKLSISTGYQRSGRSR
jgi:site-specific DNA recombinase